MSSIRRRSSRNNEIFTYEFNREHSLPEVAHWICSVINSGVVSADVLELWDTIRRNDEGNESTNMYRPIDEKKLLIEMKSRKIDRLVFSGTMERAPITINFNLETFEINIALHKDHLVDEYKIEKKLKLTRV